ncbi:MULTISPECIES: PadR family transcriptional regulator [unclassified Plantibacter]|uniref:PadR family transcriptional regulator n=1 Tax=unclassified Plantibacter TaxID=2624265 RepID=UPI000A9950E5|nr:MULTISPECIES: PadR family transcriptional regulator [unclassified Plantibacter]
MDEQLAGQDSQLLRGVLPMLILSTVQRGETYGYALVEQLRALGLTDLATGVVYPVLSRFERDGLVTGRRVASPGGPARKYYAITERGEAARLDAIARWRAMTDIAERGLDPEGARP